jgi:lipopolysaccharide export system permease protein
MFRIIHKYVVRELVGPFVFAVAVATFVLLLARIFNMVELIVTKGVPVLTVAELFAYYVPALLAMTVPGAMLIATLMAFGRLSGDNEITALKSSGVSLYSIIVPVAVVGLVLTGFTYVFLDQIVPVSNHRFKNLMLDIGMKRPDLNVRERVFIRDFPGYELYINDINERTGELTDVTVFRSEGGKLQSIITAKNGRIFPEAKPGYIVLELYNGEMHEADPENPDTYRRLRFESQQVNLEFNSELVRTMSSAKGDREMTVGEMMGEVESLDDAIARVRLQQGDSPVQREFIDEQVRSYNRRKNEFLVEVHKKVAIPFACIVFVFVGAPLGVVVRRGGKGVGFSLGLVFYLSYYIFLVAGESFGDRGIIAPWFSMWLANIVLAGFGAFLLYKAVHERSTVDFFWWLSPSRFRVVRRLTLRLKPVARLTVEEMAELEAFRDKRREKKKHKKKKSPEKKRDA